jgi:hypothetical protein
MKAAEELRIQDGRPTLISNRAISRKVLFGLGAREARGNMPKTDAALAAVRETSEEFALRKLAWAVKQFQMEGVKPSRIRLTNRACITAKWYTSATLKAAVVTSLMLW